MTFSEDSALAVKALLEFAETARQRSGPVITQPELSELSKRLDLSRLIAEGGLEGDTLRRFLDIYLQATTRLHHPRYMAHQVAVPVAQSAIAGLVDAFTNNAMAIYEMGPAAATVEFTVLNWMLSKAGWQPLPPPGGGTVDASYAGGALTHGGSLANLTALLAARARLAPEAWDKGAPANLVLVGATSGHYSVERAAGIMGLGRAAIHHAPVDNVGRIDPDRLTQCLEEVIGNGLQPIAVIANACSTALGLYDPLREISEVCRQHGVWLHVDGAHGASALISPRLRHLLDGVEHANSLTWDAHKMLRSSTVCAAVLVHDHRHLDQAFEDEASYLFHDKDQPGFDFIHRTVECTKAALGLKLFFSLAYEGEAAIASTIERQTELASAAAAYLRREQGIEVAVEPQSNIVCFRFDGGDDAQLELRRRLTQDGLFYISSTEALGRRWLRLALMNPWTELSDIEALIEELRRIRQKI